LQRTALLSVFNKEGIAEFARRLVALGFRIIASGGTAQCLEAAGISVTDVAEITNRPAVLGHRVVTLAPEIHGGLMATPEMRGELEGLGWPWIDLLCVDLYPLEAAIAAPKVTRESVIEATDIGGPTLIRSAAKGRRIVIARPRERKTVLDCLEHDGWDNDSNKEWFFDHLAAIAEGVVARYCLASARFHSQGYISGSVDFAQYWGDDD
jgi:phosphoribosylaminoimidazolecarboxamide formyltransferase / IMP cyclohydrolase